MILLHVVVMVVVLEQLSFFLSGPFLHSFVVSLHPFHSFVFGSDFCFSIQTYRRIEGCS